MQLIINKVYRGEEFSVPVTAGPDTLDSRLFAWYDRKANEIVVDPNNDERVLAHCLAHEFHHAMVFTGVSPEFTGTVARYRLNLRRTWALYGTAVLLVLGALLVGLVTRNIVLLLGIPLPVLGGLLIRRITGLDPSEVYEAPASLYASQNWQDFLGYARALQQKSGALS